MIKMAICDDDIQFLNQSKKLISSWKNTNLSMQISTFQDGDTLIQAHSISPFDIIFLDVIMPLFNGIDVAKEIRNFDSQVKIVFLTTSQDYAIQSYSVKAYNYLLKPIDKELLYSCLNDLYTELSNKPHNILIKEGHVTHIVDISKISYVESLNKNVILHLTNGNTLQSTEPLYNFEQYLALEEGFFKCNRSFIVNIYQISSYTAKEITMISGTRIPISRKRQQEFVDAYFKTFFAKVGDL